MSTPAGSGHGPETTASEVAAGVDLRSRVVLVTGASGGLGAETARALAERGARVTLAARDREKGERAMEAIRASTGSERLELEELDLASPASVRSFAERYLARHQELHILVNNAGVMGCPLTRTPEGWELQFATNHLGHFLLTCLLVPALRAGAPSRVVNLSSAGHRLSPVVFDDIHFERREYDKWMAYGQSKTANVLFAVELDRRLRHQGIRAYAVHPGAIPTDLGRHLTPDDLQQLAARAGEAAMRWKSVEAGAATSVWGATSAQLEGRGGLYLEDCGIGQPGGPERAEVGYAPHAMDPEAAATLWRVSEKLVGQSFDLC